MKAVSTVNYMALTFVSRTSLPELTRGKEGKESVTIHDNGQISLSSKATKIVGEGEGLVAVGYDAATRKMVVVAATPKIIKAVGGEGGCFKYKYNKKTKQGHFAASALLQDVAGTTFGEGGRYDYKASGNQSFDVECNEKDKTISFVLPKGSLTKKVVVSRPRKPKAPTAPLTTVPQVPATAPSTELEELNIDAA